MSARNAVRQGGSLAARVGGRVARWGAASSWTAVLHHHVTDDQHWPADNPLTAGLAVDLPVSQFADRLDVLARNYEVVGIDEVGSRPRGSRKHLVITFDDAYASVGCTAAPLLAERRLPWTFFVNPGLLDNRTVAFDNLIAYVVNTTGAAPVERASGEAFEGIGQFIATVSSRLRPLEREALVQRLVDDLGLDLAAIATRARLYLTSDELVDLARSGVDIGNHTSDHVHCRTLTTQDAASQIGDSAVALRRLTGTRVSSFAYPYGARADATPTAGAAVRAAGHERAFLVQARLNASTPAVRDQDLYRVSPRRSDQLGLAAELELLPRLRAVKHRVTSRLGRAA